MVFGFNGRTQIVQLPVVFYFGKLRQLGKLANPTKKFSENLNCVTYFAKSGERSSCSFRQWNWTALESAGEMTKFVN